MFLKWKKFFSTPFFILTESLGYLKEVELFIENKKLKINVLLDQQLRNGDFDLYYFDYQNETSKWVKS